MDQSKIGRAANAPAGPKPPEKREGLNIPDWAKWLGALGLIALAAKELFDKLGAIGRALSKIALKLAPYLGKIARIGKAIFDGIGRAISALGDIFKYFNEKGIAGFIDDLKRKLPKTTEFLEKVGKHWDDFKQWLGARWRTVIDGFKKTDFFQDASKYWDDFTSAIKLKIRTFWSGLFVNTKALKIGADGVEKSTEYTKLGQALSNIRTWWNNKVKGIFDLKWLKGAEESIEATRGATKIGKFGTAIKRVTDTLSGIGRFVSGTADLVVSGFKAIGEIGGVAFKLLGGGGGGMLGKMLSGTMKFLGKMLQPLLKKLPVIGAIMGVGFAFARFQKGEIIPAALELVSAILTFIPGIGTLGSILIDGALMLYDLDKQKKEDAAKGVKPAEGGMMSKIGKWMADWILPVVKYLPVIGSFFYFADAIKAYESKDMASGTTNLIRGLVALVGGKGLVDLVDKGLPVVMSLFTDKVEGGEETKEAKGGFFSWLGTAFSDYVKPYLKYLPVIGTIMYGMEAWDAFKAGDWKGGFGLMGRALLAIVPGLNAGIDWITSFFTDKQEGGEEAQESKGGFFTWVKEKFAEHVKPHLDKLPILAPIKYGSEAWDAFKAGDWTGGFKKLGLALLNLIPGVGFVNTGIGFIMSFFDEGDKAKIEEAKSNGGFKDMMISVFDSLGTMIVDTLTSFKDGVIAWVDGAVESAKKLLGFGSGEKEYTEEAKQNAKKYGWGEDVKGYEDSGWKTKANWEAMQKAKQTATPAATPAPTSTPAATPAAPTLTQAATPAATIAPTEMRAPATESPDRGRAAAAAAAANRAKEAAPAQVQAATPAAGQTETERRAKAMGWNTVEEYKNSGWKENPAVAKGIKESTNTVLQNAKAMGWNTVDEYKNSGWKQNPAVVKGAEDAEDPVVLRNAKAMGWNTVAEYKNSGWKQNPAMLAGAAQAAVPSTTAAPGSATTGASLTDTAAASPAAAPIATTGAGGGVAPAQVASGFATAAAPSTAPVSSAPLNQDVKANIAAVLEAVKAKGFTNEKYLAAVYGNVMKETGGKIMAENMNYSTTSNARIRSIFGSRVSGMSDAQINEIKRTPESFGNAMYGSQTKIGKNLGNVEPGDGFKFRGRGFVQLTGRAAYAKASKAIFGDDRLTQNPDLVLDRQVGALVTAWELEDRKSWAGKYGIDYNTMTQEQANMLVTSKIAGQKVTLGKGYLGSLLGKVNTYATQYNSANFAGVTTASTPTASTAPAPAPTSTPSTTLTNAPMPANLDNAVPVASAATPTASGQFQPQSINVPASGGAPVTTTWSGGESNFVINGANMGGLNSEFRRRLESMAAEYKAKTGKKINISGARSAYRTYEQQVAIAKTARPGYAATPGTSNHGFGFALDINTADANRAESLGLLQKYGLHRPMMSKSLYEPWHIEPVGLNKSALAQYRARRESGKFSGDQLAFALTGSGSSGPPYTEQSVMPTAIAAATPAASSSSGLPSAGISSVGAPAATASTGGLAGAMGNIASSFGSLGSSSDSSSMFNATAPTMGVASNTFSSTPPAPSVNVEMSSKEIVSSVDKLTDKQEKGVKSQVDILGQIRDSLSNLNKNIIALNNGKGAASSSVPMPELASNISSTQKQFNSQTSPKMFGFA